MIHIFATSGTGGDRVLYLAEATALGLLLTASRIASDSLWLPIGVHSGYDFFFGSGGLPVEPVTQPPEMAWNAVCLTAAAMLVLAWRQWRQPVRWWVPPAGR